MSQAAERMSRVDTAWLRMDNDVNLMMIVGVWLLRPGISYAAPCERVQTSRYAMFLGIPVAVIGLGGYVVLLAVALAGLQERFAANAGPTKVLVLLSGGGVAFSAYLTYLELFTIHAICRWCVGSAVVIALIFGASVVGLKEVKRG